MSNVGGLRVKVVIIGVMVSIGVFWLITLFSYLASGLFQYVSFTRFYPWLIRYFGLYIGLYSVSTGVFTSSSIYSKQVQITCRCSSAVRLMGLTISFTGSAFLVCCSPLVYVLATLLGGLVGWFAIYSKYLLLAASAVQFAGAAIILWRVRLKKLFIIGG